MNHESFRVYTIFDVYCLLFKILIYYLGSEVIVVSAAATITKSKIERINVVLFNLFSLPPFWIFSSVVIFVMFLLYLNRLSFIFARLNMLQFAKQTIQNR